MDGSSHNGLKAAISILFKFAVIGMAVTVCSGIAGLGYAVYTLAHHIGAI